MNTIEELENAIPNEDVARKYIVNLRWGKWAACPICGNERCYIIEKGTRYKCANKECNTKFTVVTKTLFHASKIPLDKLLRLFFAYGKSRGRISPFELMIVGNVNEATEGKLRRKLDFVWKYCNRDGKSNNELLDEMLLTSFNLYEKYQEIQNEPYKKNPFTVANIDNISDPKQYYILLRYTRYYLKRYCTWIFLDMGSPEDILSETFIRMNEESIKEYDAEVIIKQIQKTVNKLWYRYLDNHPKFNNYNRDRNKKRKIEDRETLADTYLVEVIHRRKGNNLTRKEIRSDKSLLKTTREDIMKLRTGY